jgi:hypothetical protein
MIINSLVKDSKSTLRDLFVLSSGKTEKSYVKSVTVGSNAIEIRASDVTIAYCQLSLSFSYKQ